MKHVFIATPAYSGQVNIPYALSLAETMHTLKLHGIQITPYITASGSLLVAERNKILEMFWRSDATHLLCVDADLGWPAQAVLAMLEQDKEFIAGCYPARGKEHTFLFRPVYNPNGSIMTEKHLLKMEYIPAGFMLISRSAIKKMRDHYPELFFQPKEPEEAHKSTYCLFNTEVRDGEFWGEDYTFCHRAGQAGIDIWVDPLIQFDHAGTIGMLMQALTQDRTQSNMSQLRPNNPAPKVPQLQNKPVPRDSLLIPQEKAA